MAAEIIAWILSQEFEPFAGQVGAPGIANENVPAGGEAAVEEGGGALGKHGIVEQVGDEDDVGCGRWTGQQVGM